MAAEVTIQPVDLLGVDAAIIFSDILEIPQAMGLPYEMIEKKGPFFPKVIRSKSDLEKIHVADVNDLKYVTDAIGIAKKELNNRIPLIGFAGAPWTIFCYMIEGQGSKTFSEARKMLVKEPSLSHELLEKITLSTISYLKAQISAGANLVQVFDSWAGILSPELYREFGLKYISQICDAINEVPVTVFSKGAYFVRKDMKGLNCETIGLDWNMHARASRKLIGEDKTLQGNLDPAVLYGADDYVVQKTIDMLDTFQGKRHIANLGHGVYPDINPEKVKLFIETVKNYKL